MSKSEIGYKLTHLNYSFANLPLYVRLEYKIGKTTQRMIGNGPLALFNTFKDAEKLFNQIIIKKSNFHIFECQYIPSKDLQLWYKQDGLNTSDFSANNLPKGTKFADSITLIREMTKRVRNLNYLF